MNWNWTFYGYETLAGNRPVQDWFDGLPEDDRDEGLDTLGYLQRISNVLWVRPRSAPVEDGLVEIRFDGLSVTYRIYGYFGPKGLRQVFTFLNGTDKKVGNQRHEKQIANGRRKQIERGEARVHKFKFEN